MTSYRQVTQAVAYKATCDLYLPVRILTNPYIRAYIVFNSRMYGLMYQSLEGIETERTVESKTGDALASKEREHISNKKVDRCTGTEALYRPYGPYGE